MRAFDQERDNLFDGWSRARIAQYARDRVILYQQPHSVFNAGERELLREAWGVVAIKNCARKQVKLALRNNTGAKLDER